MGEYIKSGIYIITNTETGECYIGSSVNVDKRMSQHRYLLRTGHHHSRQLQAAWNRYGEEAFTFDVLEIVEDANSLIVTEQRYLDEQQPVYNPAKIALRNGAGIISDPERLQQYQRNASLERLAAGEQLTSLYQEIHRLRAIIRKGDDIMSVLNTARNVTPAEQATTEQFARLAMMAYSKGMISCKDFYRLMNAIVTGLYGGKTNNNMPSDPKSEEWVYYLSPIGFGSLMLGTGLVHADISQMEAPTNQEMWDASYNVGAEIRAMFLQHGITPEDGPPNTAAKDDEAPKD